MCGQRIVFLTRAVYLFVILQLSVSFVLCLALDHLSYNRSMAIHFCNKVVICLQCVRANSKLSQGKVHADRVKTSGHGQPLAWVGPDVLVDNAYGTARSWAPPRFMDDGLSGGGRSDIGAIGKSPNKKIPPPLHNFQQQQQQQLHHHQQQQHQQKYQHFRRRHYPAAVAVGVPSTNSVLSNSTASFPSKLLQSISSSSSSSTSSLLSSSSSNVSAMTAAAPYAEADRSDSGISSSRTLNSGDERSGSHSSAFSGSDDHTAATSPLNDQHVTQPFNNVPVWRDPNMIQVRIHVCWINY